MSGEATNSEGMVIVYDGQCPFCSAYVRMLRLREGAGPVRLVDARAADPAMLAALSECHDLDTGMLVTYGGKTYHGDRAIHLLALMSGSSGFANRTLGRIFRSPNAARILYPALVAGRRLTLFLLGRRPIDASSHAE